MVLQVYMDLSGIVYIVMKGPQMPAGDGSVLDGALAYVATISVQYFRPETGEPKVFDADTIVNGRDEAFDSIRQILSSPNRQKDMLLRLSGADNLTSAAYG